LKAVIERSSERILILESEIDKNRQENEKLLKIEIDRRDSEIAKLKDDYLKLSNEFSQKNMLQRMQISDLTTKLSSLDSTFAQERLDLKKATDDAISSVMVTEQKKYDSLVSESKKALESYVASKQELEARCNGYIAEINSLRDEHGKHIEQVMSQMNSLEHEAKRVRSQNVLLKESVSSSTSENAMLKRELDDTKKRLLLSLEDSEDCHRTLQEAITERQELRSKIDKLGSELEHSVAMRSKEFDLISQTLSTTLEKEFQSLKVNLKIKELKK
jgi:chromosome segregation ATPase